LGFPWHYQLAKLPKSNINLKLVISKTPWRHDMNTATRTLLAALIWGVCSFPTVASTNVTVTVPGTADLWLAGMPSGTRASDNPVSPSSNPATLDVAPLQSPIEVSDLVLVPGQLLTFKASGLVAHGNVPPDSGPEGGEAGREATVFHLAGAEHGISDIIAPFNALLGVFLGPEQPDSSEAPLSLDFVSTQSRDYSVLAPALRQVFFIGAGKRSDGASRRITVPPGATRLFLGVMDTWTWNDNTGSFSVTVRASQPDASPSNLVNFGLYPGMWVNGTPGKTYRLEYSESLGNSAIWTPVTNAVLSVSPQFFIDTVTRRSDRGFYRAIELQ
jgi:hypothetical protein